MLGTMTLTFNKAAAINTAANDFDQRYTIVVLDQKDNAEFPDFANISYASVLLPPFQIMSLYIDGRLDEFKNEYNMFLWNDEAAISYITSLLALIWNGRNVMFYADYTMSIDMPFLEVLLYHLQTRYNIVVGTDMRPFQVLEVSEIADAVYRLSAQVGTQFITGEEFVRVYNPNKPYSQEVLMLLDTEFHPYIQGPRTYETVSAYFKNWQANMIAADQPLISVMKRRDQR